MTLNPRPQVDVVLDGAEKSSGCQALVLWGPVGVDHGAGRRPRTHRVSQRDGVTCAGCRRSLRVALKRLGVGASNDKEEPSP